VTRGCLGGGAGKRGNTGGGGRNKRKPRDVPGRLEGATDEAGGGERGAGGKKKREGGGKKKGGGKGALLERRVTEAEQKDIGLYPFGTMPAFQPMADSPAHNPAGNVVLGAFFSETMMPKDIKSFAGTARKQFSGDIVVAVHPGLKENMMQLLRDYRVIVYEVPVTCTSNGEGCTFTAETGMQKMPLAQLRLEYLLLLCLFVFLD
jgi:hypothetical protein